MLVNNCEGKVFVPQINMAKNEASNQLQIFVRLLEIFSTHIHPDHNANVYAAEDK